ncbi:hypothetical protein GWK76_01225 [Candidatus Saccharibacteria bacterium oral taxon 488]|jgi:hypothetical protein|nr:hypothetical protein GWK76_01225 [Candidatus Saccharibacteria bacterium oral taxon 488]
MNEQNMTTMEAIFNRRVDRRTVLLGGLGTVGAVAFGGAVHESREMPRDGEALQALHAVQTAAAEVAERGVNGQTTTEKMIAATLQHESGATAKVEVALSEPLEQYISDEGSYASAGANMVDGLLSQIGQDMFADTDQQMTTEITKQARPTLAFLIMVLNQRRIGLSAKDLLAMCQQYHQEAIAPSAAKQMAEARQAQLDLLEKELVGRLGQLADYDPALQLNRPVLR